MTISATIIADSISPQGIRLTTFQLRYPRFIHAEFMTHRVFSRNASSSRAIPVERLINDIRRDPAMPIHWGKNQSGMQAREEIDGWAIHDAKQSWLVGVEKAIKTAETLIGMGLHKQIVNRLLEPFSHINVVVTATQFSNFFALRDHPDAQPEICLLAQAMKAEMADSTPKLLNPSSWHLPYYEDGVWELYNLLGESDINGVSLNQARATSVARCARVSYKTHDGRTASIEEEVALCDRLLAQVPLHASPAEHQATPDILSKGGSYGRTHEWGNFTGWRQYRKMLPGECQ